MKKSLCFSMILLTAAMGRENPFFSTTENLIIGTTSNNVQYTPPLTSMTYNFPTQARILKEVTFTFQNVDGTLETRRLEIDHSIDWHSPLILSQSGKSINEKKGGSKKSSFTDAGFIQFMSSGNRISLLCKYPMIRSFSLSDPNSIAIDFKHNTSFKGYEKALDASPFTKIQVTNHGKFARAIITLDGHYACEVFKTEQGASVICK